MEFRRRGFWVIGLILLLSASMAWAQGGTSTIRGEVKDPQGAMIPGASVTLTNLATSSTRSTVSSESGKFSFELLPPGEYKLEVENQGFKKHTVQPVRALINTPTDINVRMELGSVAEVVQVDAAAGTVAVNTQDATLGNNFVSSQITQLPLEARNVTSLLTLQPGVTRGGEVAGARSDQSNVTLDGVDINDAQSNALGSTVLRLNAEAIEEFRVTTINANANQGRSSAAQVNLVTKGGTNTFHGSAFEFWRHESMTANNFFNNRNIDPKTGQSIPRPQLRRHTYGGTIGGPIVKDKAFFFYSYEGRTDHSQGSAVNVVPLPVMGTGGMRYTSSNGTIYTLTQAQMAAAFPVVGLNPTALSVLGAAAAKYPANDYTVGDSQSATRQLNTAGYRFNASTPVDLNSNVAKIDYNINTKMSVFVRMNAIYDLTAQMPNWPDTPSPSRWSHPWGGVASHTWTLSNSMVNNFRYGYTKNAFSQQGDSGANSISFRFIFSPLAFSRTLARVNPVHNIADDFSWVKGNHTFQFGTNIRLVRNGRVNYGSAFDNAITNPSFYQNSGTIISDAIQAYLDKNSLPALASVSEAQNAATALIGRYSQYTANFTYGADGKLLTSGTPTNRNFATEEYDFYFQDAFRIAPNLTLTYGLRYGLSRPVYETNGFEVAPTITLGEFFRRRVAGMSAGVPYNDPLILDYSGPANGRPPIYPWDKNNFQPRISFSWSPSFDKGILGKIFGGRDKSVLRGGFAMTNDYFGQALAVNFDGANTLGFVSNTTISANTYNVTTKPAPLFTGFNQNVRSLPGITVVDSVKFPRQTPSDFQRRIETGLDGELHSPTNFQWNFTFERELPLGLVLTASYMGRAGRDLLAQRDPMTSNNLRDPKSGQDWYTAGTNLEKIRQTRAPATSTVPVQPFFENMFPNFRNVMEDWGGYGLPEGLNATQSVYYIMRSYYGNDWTYLQDDIDNAYGKSYFYQPQYGALSAWSTVARSNYNALAVSVRQRFRNNLQWDLNYTLSHSLDDASGLQGEGQYSSAAFILNPLRPRENYANSDFDMRHMINVNGVYGLPFGRGQWIGSTMPAWADAVVGGWQLSGIFRWNSGLPVNPPYDDARWATNWNAQSWVNTTRDIKPCITKGTASTAPKFFGCDPTYAYQSFRNAYPGESGQRNIFRNMSYIALDAGLSKSFKMPWAEGHRLQIRWEVFNVTNTQHFGDMDRSRTGFGLRLDPAVRNLAPPSNWSNFTSIQGSPRVMQLGARFEF